MASSSRAKDVSGELEVSQLRVVTIAQWPALAQAVDPIVQLSWSRLALLDRSSDPYYEFASQAFADCSVGVVAHVQRPGLVSGLSGEHSTLDEEILVAMPDTNGSDSEVVLALGAAIPIRWDGSFVDLPRKGWDGCWPRMKEDYDRGALNTLVALSVMVHPRFRSRFVSSLVLRAFRALAARRQFEHLISPVRPSRKIEYPLTRMDRYMSWKDERGAPFDPWMRTHWRLGARVLGVAFESMRVEGSVTQWESWMQKRFPESGSYVIPDGLSPLYIDTMRDRGIYSEDNIWMRHPDIQQADASSVAELELS